MTTRKQKGAKRASQTAVKDNGQNAMFALWLLVSTNPTFLLSPAAKAREKGSHDVKITPGDGDKITSWEDLITKLKANNNNGELFEKPRVQAFLLEFLAKPLGNQFSTAKTYGDLLQNACSIFQEAKSLFVPGWEPPCPRTMDQIPDLQS